MEQRVEKEQPEQTEDNKTLHTPVKFAHVKLPTNTEVNRAHVHLMFITKLRNVATTYSDK